MLFYRSHWIAAGSTVVPLDCAGFFAELVTSERTKRLLELLC